MRDELKSVWQAIESNALPNGFEQMFAGIFSPDTRTFPIQETYVIDFKDKSSSKFNDPYGASIVRLVLAFYNTYGGAIVFGVHDATRQFSGENISLDIEALNTFVTECTGLRFEITKREYTKVIDGEEFRVCVALVPRRGVTKPALLIKDLQNYRQGTLWVRDRHQVLIAQPEHMQIIYSTRNEYPSDQYSPAISIQRSMPPRPATIKQFVGRTKILIELWNWLLFGDQPRVYLHGPGGSGKSAIAFEFADLITKSENEIRMANGDRIDYVVYISGKETELETKYGRIRDFHEKQFSSYLDVYRSILVDSGFVDGGEVLLLDEHSLEGALDALFDSYAGLIVLDDIDALSRKGLDTGEESLFIKILSGARRTRVLYTLRQSPSHARKSAIHVPGMDDAEFFAFIDVAQRQFEVPPPPADIVPRIRAETNSLPLLIENILGLRKFCGTYPEAIRQHSERGGDDARRYLYQREYDALDKRGKSRELMAALALLREPVRFSVLADILDFSRQAVVDSIAECESIFLTMEEDAGGETVYQLSPVASPFISGISKGLTFYEQIARKVKLYGREDFSPEETAIILRFERLIRDNKFLDIVKIYEAMDPASVALASPRIRALVGISYAHLDSNFRIKAIECFKFADSMGIFDIQMMRSWYHVEYQSGLSAEAAVSVCNKVLGRPNLAPKFRAEFYNKIGLVALKEARALRHVAREKALIYYDQSFLALCKNLFLAQINGLESSKTQTALSACCSEYINSCRGDLDAFFKSVERLADQKHDIAIDAAEYLLLSLQSSQSLPFSVDGKRRFVGHVRRCRNKLAKSVKAISEGPGGIYTVDGLARLEAKFSLQLDPTPAPR